MIVGCAMNVGILSWARLRDAVLAERPDLTPPRPRPIPYERLVLPAVMRVAAGHATEGYALESAWDEQAQWSRARAGTKHYRYRVTVLGLVRSRAALLEAAGMAGDLDPDAHHEAFRRLTSRPGEGFEIEEFAYLGPDGFGSLAP